MAGRKYDDDGARIVTGGSMHRDPSGYRITTQPTQPSYPDPLSMQRLYARVRRWRYSPELDGSVVNEIVTIYWTDEFSIDCGRCHRSLGAYVAYRAYGSEHGIVEHTARERVEAVQRPETSDAHLKTQNGNNRYRLTGTQADTSRTTGMRFYCSRCDRHYDRNMHRFARDAFYSPRKHRWSLDDYADRKQ